VCVRAGVKQATGGKYDRLVDQGVNMAADRLTAYQEKQAVKHMPPQGEWFFYC
jgi:hypothetical protein